MSDHGLAITYRADLPAIVARWQREVAPTELQAGYLAVLAAADATACTRWLLDLRRRNDVAAAAANAWIADVYFPQLANRYAEPVRLAFLVSPSRAVVAPPTVAPAHDASAAYETGIFIDEAAAYQWLAQE